MSTDIPTDSVDRRSINSNNMSTDTWPTCRPTSRPILGRHSVDISADCRSTYRPRVSTDTRSTDALSTHDPRNQKTERRPTQQSVISNNIYRSVSTMEISRNPSKYLPMMLLFLHRNYVHNYPIFYDQWSLSPQSVSAIYVYFVLTVARNRKFPYANHISYD